MPDTNKIDREISKAKTEKIIGLLDELFEVAGQRKFSDQIKDIERTVNRQSLKQHANMSDKDVNEFIENIPNAAAETVSRAFVAISATMQEILKDPNKIKNFNR